MKKFISTLLLTLFLAAFPLAAAGTAGVDLDLTKFNGMMAYTGLFNVFTDPDAYTGKVIKLKGQFDCAEDEETGKRYYCVVLMDAAACCAIGLDFVLKDNYEYPKDYPQVGAIITVAGRFEMYREGEDVFAHLVDADIL
ncbi:MAG: hypothetical protein K5841_08860 [Fretibacterium sp.]|nr:hypothetical protein [Fretibacterium sp.]